MLFITCPVGLEPLLLQELSQLGIPDLRSGSGGVFAPQEMEIVYKINYCSRLATRVLWPLATFRCEHREMLYDSARKIDWSKFLTLKQTFAIDSNVSGAPAFRNSLFAALVVKDALCDTFRRRFNARPSVATYSPDVQINLFIHKERAMLSIDTSGAPLYKRGYRHTQSAAPLQESLASSILTLANYSSEHILCDPFCGSGTFLIEAAMIATQTPAGFFRKEWGFMHLPTFSKGAWLKVKEEVDKKRTPLHKHALLGADKDPKAAEISKAHLKDAGFEDIIGVDVKDIRSYFPKTLPNFVVCNPPYGKRLGASLETYQALGHFLKTKCAPDVRAFVLTPDIKFAKAIGLTIMKQESLFHGGEKISLFSLTKG